MELRSGGSGFGADSPALVILCTTVGSGAVRGVRKALGELALGVVSYLIGICYLTLFSSSFVPMFRLSKEPAQTLLAETVSYFCVFAHSRSTKADVYTVEFLSVFPLNTSVCSRLPGGESHSPPVWM